MPMTSVLISGGTVITMDPQRRIIRDGAVFLEDRLIAQVGKTSELKPHPRAEFEIDASRKIILPGLVDTHVHLAQALIRGCADDTSLIDWLQKFVWPLQGNFDAEDGKASARTLHVRDDQIWNNHFLGELVALAIRIRWDRRDDSTIGDAGDSFQDRDGNAKLWDGEEYNASGNDRGCRDMPT